MKNKYLILTLILISLLSLNYVSAQIQSLSTSKINTNISLTQTVTNSTYCNLTKITYPNNTVLNVYAFMTKNGNDYNYYYTPDSLGTYSYITCCDPDGIDTCVGVSFEVTPNGTKLTTSQSITYTIIFIISLLILIALLIVGIFLPSKNKTDQMTGYIIALENLKYLKFFSLMFAYIVALLISYFSYSICYTYLDFTFLTSLTYFLFYGLLVCTLVFFPIMIYLLISNWIHDNAIMDGINRGLHIR